MKVNLTRDENIWVKLKWEKIRASQVRADEAGNRWTRINAEIKDHLDRHHIYDIVQREKIKRQSIPLKDAHDDGKWHSAEAQRHIADLDLFLKLKELEVL